MDIHNLACFEYFKKVDDKSVNLFVLDLPYTTTNWGKTTACKWDTPIDLEKMWVEIKRIMKNNAIIIFFCNTKFGFNLIQSNQKWFKYDLIWKKSRKVGFLSANKMPLRQHENIYIFKKEGGTYNSQLEEGEPHNRHKYKGHNTTDTYYNVSLPFNVKENKGTRHPTSILEMGERHPTNILEFSNPSKSIHKTQKPVDLLEWLIKSYSNEGDLICDFTFGSGSTAIACLNTKRRFTGCERDTDIFKTAKQRIEEHNVEEFKKEQEERKKKEIKKKIKEYKKFIEKHKT